MAGKSKKTVVVVVVAVLGNLFGFADVAVSDSNSVCAGRFGTVRLELGESPTAGADVIIGTSGDDVIRGGDGNDVICGRGGNDTIIGGPGEDWIYGGAGNDRLDGSAGFDVIEGGRGKDRIKGGTGNDRLSGDAGRDRINGGAGLGDVCVGGRGKDKVAKCEAKPTKVCPEHFVAPATMPNNARIIKDKSNSCPIIEGVATPGTSDVYTFDHLDGGFAYAVQTHCGEWALVAESGKEMSARLSCSTDVEYRSGGGTAWTYLNPGIYTLTIEHQGTTSAPYRVWAFDESRTAQRQAPQIAAGGCSQTPAQPTTLPVRTRVVRNGADCPIFNGEIAVPFETDRYVLALRAGEKVSARAEGFCGTMTVRDGRDVLLDSTGCGVHTGNFTAPSDGSYTFEYGPGFATNLGLYTLQLLK